MKQEMTVIESSLRMGSNSSALAEAFAQGAEQSGIRVNRFALRGRTIGFCTGCLVCQTTRTCVQSDAMQEAVDLLRRSQIVVFATPIYFYGLSGQLKTFLDRTEPLYQTELPFRSVYLLCAAAETEDWVFERAEADLQGWMDCFPGQDLVLRSVLRAGGVAARGSISPQSDFWKQAYRLGLEAGERV